MLVKKFEAPSLEQALALVKNELGPNALILSTTQKRRKWYQKPVVEVTAAFEKKVEPTSRQGFDEAELMEVFPHRRYEVADVKPLKAIDDKRYAMTDREEPQRQAIKKVKMPVRPVEEKFESRLTELGFSSESSKEMSRKLTSQFQPKELQQESSWEKSLAKVLAAGLRVYGREKFFSRSGWAVIGAAGAGKTSLVVKLALSARTQSRKACLIGRDQRKASGYAELSTYAQMLDVPFHVDLNKSESDFLLIDTAAVELSDGPGTQEIERACEGRSTVLVVDATQRLNEMLRLAESAARYSPVAVVFTKLDLVSQRGALYDFLNSARLPLLGVSLSDSLRTPFRFLESLEAAHMVSQGS